MQEVIDRFESTFPARIVSYYWEGSYAEQTAIATRAVDITIVFRERFSIPRKQARYRTNVLPLLLQNCALDCYFSIRETQRKKLDNSTPYCLVRKFSWRCQ